MSNIRYNGFKPQITKTADVKTIGKASVEKAGVAGGAGSVGSAGLGTPMTINTKVYTPNAPTQDNSGVMLTKDVNGKGGRTPTVTTGLPTSSNDVQTPPAPTTPAPATPVSTGDVTGSPNVGDYGLAELTKEVANIEKSVDQYMRGPNDEDEINAIIRNIQDCISDIRNARDQLRNDIMQRIQMLNNLANEASSKGYDAAQRGDDAQAQSYATQSQQYADQADELYKQINEKEKPFVELSRKLNSLHSKLKNKFNGY